MNYYFLVAGLFALFATMGHFTIGVKDYLLPVLESDTAEIPKNIVRSLFHYMSVFMVLTTFVLMGFAFGTPLLFDHTADVGLFIGIVYGCFAVAQFILALTSGIKRAPLKMFQWVFWLLIAAFSILA